MQHAEAARDTQPAPATAVFDSVLAPPVQRNIALYLNQPGWNFGWKSDPKADPYAFWHKHFAGNIYPDHQAVSGPGQQYECADELRTASPLLFDMWELLEAGILRGHRLLRCYANGQPFGSEGTVHTDSVSNRSFTAIYYPHEKWDANWGGETIFLNRDRTDIVAAIFPRPNRLVVFPGTIPHVARSVSRTCPVMRITLMFKTELL